MSTNDLTATETWMKFAFAGEYLDNALGLIQAAKQELAPVRRAAHRTERRRGSLTDCHRGLCGAMKKIPVSEIWTCEALDALNKVIDTSYGPAPIRLQPDAMSDTQPTLPTSTQSHK